MIGRLLSWTSALGLCVAVLSATASAQDKASVRLDWVPTAAHAFVYLAKEKGFYAAEGIDLDIVPGEGSPTVIKLVGNGENDFGFADGSGLVRAWEVGVPLTALHVLFPETPTVIFASKASGIRKLQDACGHKFGVVIQSTTYAQVKAMLKAANVTCSMEEIPVSVSGTREFVSGAVDMIHTYSFNEPVFKLQGFDVVHFDVRDYFRVYSQALIASDKAMKRGDLAQRFLRASLKGLEANLEDPKEALAALGRANKELNLQYEAAKMPLVLDLMTVPGDGGRKIPQQTLAGWNETVDNLMKFGTIKKKVDPSRRFVVATQ